MTDVLPPSPPSAPSPTPPTISAPSSSPPPPDEHGPVPFQRFSEINAKLNEATAKLARVEAENLSALQRAATADTLARQLEEAKKGWEQERSLLQEDLSLVGVGLADDEGRVVARSLFQRLPPESRPASIGEWISGMKAEEIPRGLAGYLLSGKASPAPPKPTTAPLPKPPAASAHAPAGPVVVTEEMIRSTMARFTAGDKSALEDLKKLGI